MAAPHSPSQRRTGLPPACGGAMEAGCAAVLAGTGDQTEAQARNAGWSGAAGCWADRQPRGKFPGTHCPLRWWGGWQTEPASTGGRRFTRRRRGTRLPEQNQSVGNQRTRGGWQSNLPSLQPFALLSYPVGCRSISHLRPRYPHWNLEKLKPSPRWQAG